MDRTKYARLSEALRVTESTLRAPAPSAGIDEWQKTDGHVRIAASLHRSLGNFGGALKLLRWFRDSTTIASTNRPELTPLADHAATAVWEWESESAVRHDKTMALRMSLLDAELRNNHHDVRAVRMAMADHEEAAGNFGEAATQLYEVALRLPAEDPSQPLLRDRIDDLSIRCDLQRDLVLPPAARPVLADDQFLTAPTLEHTVSR